MAWKKYSQSIYSLPWALWSVDTWKYTVSYQDSSALWCVTNMSGNLCYKDRALGMLVLQKTGAFKMSVFELYVTWLKKYVWQYQNYLAGVLLQ